MSGTLPVATVSAMRLPHTGVAEAPAGSREWHTRLAELLRLRGEIVAARGHDLRGLEASGGS